MELNSFGPIIAMFLVFTLTLLCFFIGYGAFYAIISLGVFLEGEYKKRKKKTEVKKTEREGAYKSHKVAFCKESIHAACVSGKNGGGFDPKCLNGRMLEMKVVSDYNPKTGKNQVLVGGFSDDVLYILNSYEEKNDD